MIRVASGSYRAAIRLLLAALAVVGQLLIGAVVPAAAEPSSGPAPFGVPNVICHAPAPSGAPDTGRHRHNADCALCPLCVALAPVAALLSAPPRPPVRVLATIARPIPPPTRPATPSRVHATPPPRGPPATT